MSDVAVRRFLFAGIAPFALAGLAACDDLTPPDNGDPVDLSYAPCIGSLGVPTWFAVQDGDGGWTRVTSNASGAFNFTISSGRGGIAQYSPGSGLFIVYATTAELQANMPACNGGGVRTVTGTAQGYASADNVEVAMGGTSVTLFGNVDVSPSQFELTLVDANATDLLARRYRSAATFDYFDEFPTNVVLRRGVTGTSGGTVDFASATEAGAPLQRTLSVTNLAVGEELNVHSNVFLTSSSLTIARYQARAADVSGGATAPFYAVAGTRLSAGEGQSVAAIAVKPLASSVEGRYAITAFTDPADRSVTLGPVLGSVTVQGGNRPSASYAVQAAYDKLFDVIFSQSSGASLRQAEVLATRDYLGASTGTVVVLRVPDLSGAAGFNPAWLLATGSSATWEFLATDADMAGVLNSKPVSLMAATRLNTFTP